MGTTPGPNTSQTDANDRRRGTIGERCDEDGCHIIPDTNYHSKPLTALYAGGRKHHRIEGREEVLYDMTPAGAGSISSGKYRHDFQKEEVHPSTITDCRDAWQTTWQSSYGGSYDTCSYTDKKSGHSVPAGMKLDKKGNLVEKYTGSSSLNCRMLDVPDFNSNLDRFTTRRMMMGAHGQTHDVHCLM